ncbi:peptidase M14, carboxypeptidase A [Ramicandelaber brevisporus]|nr:peptidase M14, carboxypeptidase A [Ramicandelaber brevisporus]
MAWFFVNLAQNYSDIVKLQPSIGKTVEGRDIFAVFIGAKTSYKDEVSQLSESTQLKSRMHAREWISGAVCTYLADALVRGYTSQNSRITSILNSTQVVLVPVINADGYVYSWEVDRLWRKSRKVNDDGSVGVDTNRNWPFHFGEQGASSQGSSEVFHGSRAGSEPEVQAVVSFYSSLPRKVGAIDMHAYSQLILRPYAFTSSPNPDDDSLNNIATKMADAIKGVRGTKYENLATNTGLYPASGVAGDWFNQREPDGSGGLGVHSLTIELSPAVGSNGGGLAGFQLPPEQIRKVGAEVTEGILTFIEEAVAHPLNSNTKD